MLLREIGGCETVRTTRCCRLLTLSSEDFVLIDSPFDFYALQAGLVFGILEIQECRAGTRLGAVTASDDTGLSSMCSRVGKG